MSVAVSYRSFRVVEGADARRVKQQMCRDASWGTFMGELAAAAATCGDASARSWRRLEPTLTNLVEGGPFPLSAALMLNVGALALAVAVASWIKLDEIRRRVREVSGRDPETGIQHTPAPRLRALLRRLETARARVRLPQRALVRSGGEPAGSGRSALVWDGGQGRHLALCVSTARRSRVPRSPLSRPRRHRDGTAMNRHVPAPANVPSGSHGFRGDAGSKTPHCPRLWSRCA